MHRIINFRTGSGVRTEVMHRGRSWTVFSVSLFGVDGCGVLATLGFFISSFSAVLALDFTAPVVYILDGDKIEVLHNTRAARIRLSGIDSPE